MATTLLLWFGGRRRLGHCVNSDERCLVTRVRLYILELKQFLPLSRPLHVVFKGSARLHVGVHYCEVDVQLGLAIPHLLTYSCHRPFEQIVSLLEAQTVLGKVPGYGEGGRSLYRPSTANNFMKLRRQPLWLEGYLKQGAKYPSRMNPLSLRNYPNNVKAFFTKEAGFRRLGGGLDLWKRCYQNVRPAHKQLLINVDVTAGALKDVALSVLDKNDVHVLRLDPSSPEFHKLKSFFKNASVTFEHIKSRKEIMDIIPRAGYYEFKKEDTRGMAVQQYYRKTLNIHLKYPDIIGITLKGPQQQRNVGACLAVRVVSANCDVDCSTINVKRPQLRLQVFGANGVWGVSCLMPLGF
ncbi:hypothetical protein SCLCIDRAFT_28441 [Scleroderma citrinum Foug A]|uniref:Argonaute linker 1 domain-containing protein n=1 Tax=Scleroderma citrinum Foug A TaxID=1036808 RepID=A0A0C3DB01_9AGAM|nr:hypothetical protein SCLCIDRAFT_28441 [Scleroderma citrinum Foug A]